MAFTPAFTAAFVKPSDIDNLERLPSEVITFTPAGVEVTETFHDNFLAVNDSIDPNVTQTQHDSFLPVNDSIDPEVTETQHDNFLAVSNITPSDIEVTETQHSNFRPVTNVIDPEVTETQHSNFRPVTNSIDPNVTQTQHDNFRAVSNPSQAPVTNDFDIMSDASTVTFSAILAKEKNVPITFNYQPYTTLDTDTQSVSGDGRVILNVSTYTLLIYGGFEDTDREDLFTALRGCDRFRFNGATLSVKGLGIVSENKINDDFSIVVISFLPLTHLNSAGGVML